MQLIVSLERETNTSLKLKQYRYLFWCLDVLLVFDNELSDENVPTYFEKPQVGEVTLEISGQPEAFKHIQTECII